MTGPELITRAEKKTVALIREHTHGLSKVYLAPAGRGRWAVVVINVVTRKRVDSINEATLRGLQRHKLVEFDAADSVREDLRDYIGRRHLDTRYGYPITLTDGGRAL